MEGGQDGGSSLSMEGDSSQIEGAWMGALVGEAKVEGAQGASCRGGRHYEGTPGTLMWSHLTSWAEEEGESWGVVLESPVGVGAWGMVGAQGTGLKDWELGRMLEEGKA